MKTKSYAERQQVKIQLLQRMLEEAKKREGMLECKLAYAYLLGPKKGKW